MNYKSPTRERINNIIDSVLPKSSEVYDKLDFIQLENTVTFQKRILFLTFAAIILISIILSIFVIIYCKVSKLENKYITFVFVTLIIVIILFMIVVGKICLIGI